jgi:hypothetical protein
MVRISRLASLLRRSGRREFRAKRWDADADRYAASKLFWANQSLSLDYMFLGNLAEEARITAQEFWQAETTARKMAAAIREGKR